MEFIKNYFPVILASSIISVFFILIQLSLRQGKKRIEELKKYAKKNNFEYYESNKKFNVNKINILGIFDQGRDDYRHVFNIILKKENRFNIYWGDHIFITGYGKFKNIHIYSFVAIDCRKLLIPGFIMQDKGVISSFSEKIFNKQEMGFEIDNKFSQKFEIEENDSRTNIINFFTDNVKKAFISYIGNKKGYKVYGFNNILIVEKPGLTKTVNENLELEQNSRRIFNIIYSEHVKENNY